MDRAWLCDRCTGLYLGGLLGVAHAPLLARWRWAHRLLLGLALLLPLAVDKLYLGVGSTWDVTTNRIVTGLAAGAALGLLFGAAAAPTIRWPGAIAAVQGSLWRWSWVAAVSASALFALGLGAPLNALVLLGLIALCLTATAWGLDVITGLLRRLRRKPEKEARRLEVGLPSLAALVALELFLVAVTPSEYKPTLAWIWAAASWFGVDLHPPR